MMILLSFSGCSLSTDVIDTVSGMIGVYTLDDATYMFAISDDANSYTDSDNILVYASRGTDYIIYKGYDENNDPITVHLTELSGLSGVFTLYKGNAMIRMSGFSWGLYTLPYKIRNLTGTYYIDDKTHTFTIGNDGLTLTDNYYNNNTELNFSQIGDDYMEYRGWIGTTWVTIALTNVTDNNGTYLRYEEDIQTIEAGFFWK